MILLLIHGGWRITFNLDMLPRFLPLSRRYRRDSAPPATFSIQQLFPLCRPKANSQNDFLRSGYACEREFSEDTDKSDEGNEDPDEDREKSDENTGESDEDRDESNVGRDGSGVDSGGSDDSGHREVSHSYLTPRWWYSCIGRVEYFWLQLEYRFIPHDFETPKSIEKYGMPHERRFNISTIAGAGGIYIIDLEDATGIMDVSYQLARIVPESGGVVESSFIRDENNLIYVWRGLLSGSGVENVCS